MPRFDLGFGFPDIARRGADESWLAGASLALDLVNNKSNLGPLPETFITSVRTGTAYAEDKAGNYSAFGTTVPRRTDKGWLLEPARTNSIRNNSHQGAALGVLGSGGSLGTNWTIGGGAGITVEVVALGVHKGMDYADIRISGTPSATSLRIRMETPTGIAAATGQLWNTSCFLSLVGGSLTNVAGFFVLIDELDSGGVSVAQGTLNVQASLTSTIARFELQRTLSGGGTVTNVRPNVGPNFTIGQAVDFTIRVAWPQCEQGTGATSPIRTTSAAVLRPADAHTVLVPTNYVNLGEGTAVVKYRSNIIPTTASAFMFRLQVDTNNHISGRLSTSGRPLIECVVASVNEAQIIAANPIPAINTPYKLAARWKTNDVLLRNTAGIGNGADVSANMPTGAFSLCIGNSSSSGTSALNGWIEEISFFQTAQSDAFLDTAVL